MKYRYDFNNLDDLRVINPSAVTQFVYPSPSKYNAVWDSILHPNGKVYFALCTELTTSAYTKLVAYDPQTNTVEDIFDSEAMILPNDRFIRDSKLHTSLSLMEDERLIMATHTTDKSPEHPAWMPFSNYANPWEGYAGSSVLTYDPKTNTTENHGILVPRETLYGGIYDKKNKVYYTLGFMKGHLYRYQLDNREVTDLGKQVERASYRMIEGPDGHLYFSTRNGQMKRINTDTQELEVLPLVLPNAKDYNHAYLTYGALLKDTLYLSGMHHNEISYFNTTTNEFGIAGKYVDYDRLLKDYDATHYIGAMIFDKKDTLWYVVCGARLDNNEDFIPAATLMKWDLVNNPINMGVVGTEKRASVRTCSMHYLNDTLIIVGTNHANDGTEITCVNIDNLSTERGPVCQDPLIYPNNGLYDVYGQSIVDHWDIVDDNFYYAKGIYKALALWDQLKTDEVITNIVFEDRILVETNLNIYELVDDTLTIIDTPMPIKTKHSLSHLKNLPYYNGRQYRAQVDKAIEFEDHSYLVATLDGMFALVKDDQVFSMGALGVYASVLDMIKLDAENVVGIMGDKDDLNQLFTFNRKTGLKVLGIMGYEDHEKGAHHSAKLGSLTYDPTTKTIIVSSKDAMSTLYYLSKGDIV